MPASNFKIDRGGDFVISFDIQDENGAPIDLTGYVASSVFKKHETSMSSWSFNAVANSSGIHLSVNNSVTSTVPEGYYRWDVRVTSPAGDDSYPLWGKVKIGPNVTP
jgi:hypothetical protein